jgi:hypothetical protein
MNAVSPIAAASEPISLEPSPSSLPPLERKGSQRLARPCSTRVPEENVDDQLAALTNMERTDLIALWRRLFRSSPPDRIRRDLLELGIAWKLQEKAFGGLKKAIASELRRLSDDLTETGDIRRAEEPLLKPGTRLLREWGGTIHEVTVLDDGFLWNGKIWKSLSAIAAKITGAHWSGPRLFDLKKRSSPATAREASRGAASSAPVAVLDAAETEEAADA